MPSKLEQSVQLPSSKAPALVADLASRLAVVITHPWGPLGGNLHNNVVSAAALYFQKWGVTTLRFDFVGSQIGRGDYQVQQVQEAAEFLLQGRHLMADANKPTMPPLYILLVGYSYGALIAGSASADIPQCIGCVSISPPFAVKHWLLLFHSNHHVEQARKRATLPRLMVLGTNDNFTSEDKFRRMVDSFPQDSTTGAMLKAADHFYSRREKDLMAVVGQWLLSTYPECDGALRRLAQVELQGYQEYAAESSSAERSGSYAASDVAAQSFPLDCAAMLNTNNCQN